MESSHIPKSWILFYDCELKPVLFLYEILLDSFFCIFSNVVVVYCVHLEYLIFPLEYLFNM